MSTPLKYWPWNEIVLIAGIILILSVAYVLPKTGMPLESEDVEMVQTHICYLQLAEEIK